MPKAIGKRGSRAEGTSDSHWIAEKSLTPHVALGQNNIEMRRVACEILGWDAVLNDPSVASRTINKHPNPEIGHLIQVNLPGTVGRSNFLSVRCGTGRQFAIPVPPGIKTALEANAWTYGVAVDEYQPEVRT